MNKKGWKIISCSCAGGLQWGGYEPKECPDCDGVGNLCIHLKSGVLALYPGGPFRGRVDKNELKELQNDARLDNV